MKQQTAILVPCLANNLFLKKGKLSRIQSFVPLFGCFFKPACLINRASCKKLPEQKLPNREKQQTLQQPPIWSEAKFSKHSEHIHKHDDEEEEMAVYDS